MDPLSIAFMHITHSEMLPERRRRQNIVKTAQASSAQGIVLIKNCARDVGNLVIDAWLPRALDKVHRLAEEATPYPGPEALTVEAAETLLEAFFRMRLKPTRIARLAEGGLALWFSKGARTAKVEVSNDSPRVPLFVLDDGAEGLSTSESSLGNAASWAKRFQLFLEP